MSTDLRAFRQRSGAVDFVAQLANITGPWVTDQARQGVVGEVQVWQVQFQAGIVEQLFGDGHQVGGALAQRRQAQADRGQPVIKVAAKTSGGDILLQVAMGRRDHPHIDPYRARGADRAQFALLQDAQQLDLKSRRGVADFIE